MSEEDKTQNAEGYIEYKVHDEFFKTFFQLRFNYLESHFEFYTSPNNSNRTKLTGALIALVKWASQINAYIDPMKLNQRILDASNKDATVMYNEFNKIFDEVSALHEKTELIPKVHQSNANWMYDHEDAIVKAARQAFALLNPNG